MSKKLVENIIVTNINLLNVKDGEYIGSCFENPVEVELKVIIKNNKIVEIIILRHQHGMGRKAEDIIYNIMAKQSLEVDTISGATASSKVILTLSSKKSPAS